MNIKRSAKTQKLQTHLGLLLIENKSFQFDKRRLDFDNIPDPKATRPEHVISTASGCSFHLAEWFHWEGLKCFLEGDYSVGRQKFARSLGLLPYLLYFERFTNREKQRYFFPDEYPLFITHLICCGLDDLAKGVLKQGLMLRQDGLPFPQFHPAGLGPRFLPLVTALWRDWSHGEIDIYSSLNQSLPVGWKPIEVFPCYQTIIDHYLDPDASLLETALEDAAAIHLKDTRESSNSRTSDFDSPSFALYPVELLLAIELRARAGLSSPKLKHELFHLFDFAQLKGIQPEGDPSLEKVLARVRELAPDFPTSLTE